MKHTNTISPVKNRILSLDVLRGFALLGILTMNIIIFALPMMHYANPMVAGDLQGADKWVFNFNYVFANLRFMSIFAMLFGAGVVLFTEKATQRAGNELASRQLHYFRNFWLFIFGVLHAYLIWHGDILMMYALCSIWVYLYRVQKPITLFIWAAALIVFNIFMFYGLDFLFKLFPDDVYNELCDESWYVSQEKLFEEIKAYRGGWLQQMEYRLTNAFKNQFMIIFFGWHTTALMLIGMAMYKLDILTARRSNAFYIKMLIACLAIGLPLALFGLQQNYAHQWSCEFSMLKSNIYVILSSLPMGLAYVAIIMLLCKSRFKQVLFNWLAPVGKMALTNYLMQSILATGIFYGHGLGLFGNYGRAELYLFVMGIWVFQILFSYVWMKRFQFGPFEWLWRSLTYWKIQPMRKQV